MRSRRPEAKSRSGANARRGVVLIAVLVVVVLLGLAAFQYSEVMTAEYKAVDSAARAAQARALAASGIHYAAALLSNKDSYTGTLGSNPYDNSGAFQNIGVGSSRNPRYNGRFSIVAPLPADDTNSGATGFRYGVTDECAKINLNGLMQLDATGKVLHDMLMKLPNMTEEIADAVVDWIDADDDPRANGAENQYYSGLSPNYRCKNGPLDSLEELLLVRGVTPELLFGSDRNRNGTTEEGETAGGAQPNDRGWSAYLTIYSRERNVDAENQPRTYLNDSDVATMSEKLSTAVGPELADFILAYKLYGPYNPQSSGGGGSGGGGQSMTIVTQASGAVQRSQLDMSRRPQAISSIFALVNAKVGISTTSQATTTTATRGRNGSITMTTSTSTITRITVYTSPLADPSKARQLLPILLDKCTTRRDAELPARINLLNAPAAIIGAMPGLDETDIANITDKRPTGSSGDSADPVFQTAAWLYTEANLSPAKLQALERYVTAAPQVFRVQSLGHFETGGPVARVEAVIDTNAGQPRIVYWRDLSELGKGFDIPK